MARFQPAARSQPLRYLAAAICLGLVLLTLIVYGQVRHHGFVGFDDDRYVTENPPVRQGLTPTGIHWAFTTFHSYNWHPLTWLSHMLDCSLFGVIPGRHHLTSIVLHAGNALLLFLVLLFMTGRMWPSALVGALLALHPLHVESVAWIAERKDVLCAFFWLLTLGSYGFYARQPSISRYLVVVFFFGLGLMAKPMLVTLPFALLLLDFWPLGRLSLTGSRTGAASALSGAWQLIREKVPLFGLAAGSIVVTVMAQQAGGALKSLDAFPLGVRLGNALVTYVAYLGKAAWPADLAVFYPHPGMPPVWKMVGASALLSALSYLAWRWRDKRPYLAVGWLWYLGTLIPVIGIVQVGHQAMADRYAYIPLIGIYVVVAWGLAELGQNRPAIRPVLVVVAAAGLVLMAGATWRQAAYWKNTETLFRHALAVTTENHLAHFNLGVYLEKQGRLAEAEAEFKAALRLNPRDHRAHNSLGVVLARQGRTEAAARQFAAALNLRPDFADAHVHLGNALAAQGDYRQAIGHYQRALAIAPRDVEVMGRLALAYYHDKAYDQSRFWYQKIDALAPGHPEISYNVACLFALQQRVEESIFWLKRALAGGYDNWNRLRSDPDLENIRGTEAYRALSQGRR